MDVEQCWDCGKLISSGIIWDDKVVCLSCLYAEDERRLVNEQSNTETQKRFSEEVVRLAETFLKIGNFQWLDEETGRVAEKLGVSPYELAIEVEWHVEDLINL